jgi:hypothetical protein
LNTAPGPNLILLLRSYFFNVRSKLECLFLKILLA